MALLIKTTGVEDYLDGSANIRMMIVGAGGAGKTRFSSFWPKPIYAACEAGIGSILDRNMPYADINNSQDMLDFLEYLKRLERTPKKDRQYQTVVIDTVDSFQRKLQEEWLQLKGVQTFSGFDAWGWLDQRMSTLLTRMLNLDYNCLLLMHPKTIGGHDDQPREQVFRLKGEVANYIQDGLDLIGYMGTFYEAEGGERVEKRGLSFKKTPDRDFIKDRYKIMPPWLPITLTSEEDYAQIFLRFIDKADSLSASEVLGEIPTASEDEPTPTPPPAAVSRSGALPPIDPKEIPLEQNDKPTLVKMCRDEGVTTTVDGAPIRGNTGKGELLAAFKAHRAKASEETHPSSGLPQQATPPAQEAQADTATTPAPREPAPVETDSPDAPSTPVEADSTPAETPPAPENTTTPDSPLVETEVGMVDPKTGEVSHDKAVEALTEALGASVLSDATTAETPQVTEEPKPATPADICEKEGCSKDLTTEPNQDLVLLSRIKLRKRLCNTHFEEAK